VDFNKILNQWLAVYPKGQIPIEAQARIDALKDLFQSCKDAGFPMEFFTNTVKGKITTNCINPNHPNKRKKKNWIEYVNKHMEIAFYQIYDGSAVMEENDMVAPSVSAEDIAGEFEATEEKVKEVKVKEVKVKEPKLPKIEHYAKEDHVPTIDSEFDPEMMDLLGIPRK
jgi:ribosomal protein S12 methylthiotransferase accessory factor YcaO